MAVFIDMRTGFEVGDAEKPPFGGGFKLDPAAVQAALEPMVLSASGWRKVFAASGDEEDNTAEVGKADLVLAAAMADVYSRFVRQKSGKDAPNVLIAMDSRPTGPALADVMLRVLAGLGLKVSYIFISAAPEAMAYARNCPELDGFIYISASHNPIGHNGVKFGLKSGGVIPGSDAAVLIKDFRELAADAKRLAELISLADCAGADQVSGIYEKIESLKDAAMGTYRDFTIEVCGGFSSSDDNLRLKNELTEAVKARPAGVLAEFNGSARTLSIDLDYMRECAIKTASLNDKPRQISHRIVPEGRSLDECRQELEKLYKSDNDFLLGYVPDNDGDRGNVVYIDPRTGKAHIIEAQDVFAMSCVAELSYMFYCGVLIDDGSGKAREKAAVVVNGPTSMRIDRIAECFGVEVRRAEVGEANVVNLADRLRNEGWTVRILGEGSNGGNITHPAAVRDPLNTVFAFVKLLCLRGSGSKKGLFQDWLSRRGRAADYRDNFSLADVLDSLPSFCTTSAYEDKAVRQVSCRDYRRLKAAYEEVFLTEWEAKKPELNEKTGISAFQELNYEGMEVKSGMGSDYRSGEEKGGFKLLFTDDNGKETAYIWMRPSGTEPVFRVLADVEGSDPSLEKYLLDWHIAMLEKADKSCS